MQFPSTPKGRGRYLGMVDSSLLHAYRCDSSDSVSLSPELKDSVRLLAFLILILSKFGSDCVDGIMLAGFVN